MLELLGIYFLNGAVKSLKNVGNTEYNDYDEYEYYSDSDYYEDYDGIDDYEEDCDDYES